MNPLSNREAQRTEAARRVYDATKASRRLLKSRSGTGEVLLTIWPDGDAELAERERPWDTWGPPRLLQLVRVEEEEQS